MHQNTVTRQAATVPCYTCRRRRVKCDMLLPGCRKCHASGRDCLGYQKPLVWNKGVASRGKMMGKNFEDIRQSSSGSISVQDQEQDIGIVGSEGFKTESTAGDIQLAPMCAFQTIQTRSPEAYQSYNIHTDGISPSYSQNSPSSTNLVISRPGSARSLVPFTNSSNLIEDDTDINKSYRTFSGIENTLFLSRTLMDPLFQDLDNLSRHYLHYFDQQVCRDVVLYDLPGQNPFRELIPISCSNPLLSDIMLAVAARHASHRKPHSAFSSIRTLSSTPGTQMRNSTRAISEIRSESHAHSLGYKQLALRRLKLALQEPNHQNDDITIAATFLFIWLEMLESGKNTWRIHLEGAKQMIRSRNEQPRHSIMSGGQHITATQASMRLTLHDHVVDSCIIYDIMGTTLAQSTPILPSLAVYNALKRSEKWTFLGCPADLLYLILLVNWRSCPLRAQAGPPSEMGLFVLPKSTTTPSLDIVRWYPESPPEVDIASILSQIHSFDPILWSFNTQSGASSSDLSRRTHLGQAYKSAVLIYAYKVLAKPPLSGKQSVIQLADSILTDLSYIPVNDPLFKTMVWPTFIAGTEIETPSQRDCVRGLLYGMWTEYKSDNIANAAQVLEDIWNKVDREAEGGEHAKGQFNWTEDMAQAGVDWLFI